MAVRTAKQLSQAAKALLRDDAPDYDIDPSEVAALLQDVIDSVPALATEAARDAAGALLAVLDQFGYDARTNVLTLDLSAYEPIAPRFYFGLSDDARPNANEATIRSGTGSGLVPGFSNMRVLIYRIGSDPDISHVEFSDAPGVNRIGDFTKYARRGVATTVALPGGLQYKAWYGTNPMTKANPVTVTAR